MADAGLDFMGCQSVTHKAALHVTVTLGDLLEEYVVQVQASVLAKHQRKVYGVINARMGTTV